MKEATGELNMTLITVIAIAAILAFVVMFVPSILNRISGTWGDQNKNTIDITNSATGL